MIINQRYHNENLYKIMLATNLAQIDEFEVYAFSENEAIDLIVEYIAKEKMGNVYLQITDIEEEIIT